MHASVVAAPKLYRLLGVLPSCTGPASRNSGVELDMHRRGAPMEACKQVLLLLVLELPSPNMLSAQELSLGSYAEGSW